MRLKILPQQLNCPFDEHRFNVHSQCGEDGVIKYLLGLAGIDKGYFVEFGAWDGKHLSNCAWLAEQEWEGCFIEGDTKRFEDLHSNYGENCNVSTLNAFVRSSGEDALDKLLDRVHAPKEITVLSIDIDGNDYRVWEALAEHSALLCVIEFNPPIPALVALVQDDDPALNFGNSLAALWELAVQKDYSLVAATDWNAFFMSTAVCQKFSIPSYTPNEVKNIQYESALFHGYNGQMMVSGYTELVWHGVPFDSAEFQILPKQLQELPVGRDKAYYEALEVFKARRKCPGN